MTVFLAFGSPSDQVIALICGTSVPLSWWIGRYRPQLGVGLYMGVILLWTAWHLRQPDAFEYRWGMTIEQAYNPLASLITLASATFFGWRGGIAALLLALGVAPFASPSQYGALVFTLLLFGLMGQVIHSLIAQLETTRHRLSEMSRRDPLTGLGNRRAFAEDVVWLKGQTLEQNQPLYLILWDLDGLKTINDRDGHAAGDAFILEFVEVLAFCTPKPHYLYRVGGDEFCTLLTDANAEELIARVTRRFPSVSAGIAPVDRQRPEHALEVADAQMYQHKRGKQREKIGA